MSSASAAGTSPGSPSTVVDSCRLGRNRRSGGDGRAADSTLTLRDFAFSAMGISTLSTPLS